MKRQLKLVKLTPKQLSIGDKVKIIDGSTTSSKEHPNIPIYIVDNMEGLLSKQLSKLICTVVAINLEGNFIANDISLFEQDTLIEVEGFLFYTHSILLEKVECRINVGKNEQNATK